MHIRKTIVTSKDSVNLHVCRILIYEANSASPFVDEIEKKYFLDMLFGIQRSFRLQVYAYCVLDREIHILAGAKREAELSSAIECLKDLFTQYYKGRYSASAFALCSTIQPLTDLSWEQVAEVCAELHALPIQHRRVRDAEDYWWSGLQEYLSEEHPQIVCKEELLGCLDADEERAVQKMRAFQRRYTADLLKEKTFREEKSDAQEGKKSFG